MNEQIANEVSNLLLETLHFVLSHNEPLKGYRADGGDMDHVVLSHNATQVVRSAVAFAERKMLGLDQPLTPEGEKLIADLLA